MNYPISYPFARFLSRLGVTLSVRIEVTFDAETEVYVATSLDVPGLVLESSSFQGLVSEAQEAVVTLIELSNKRFHAEADLIFKDHIVLA